MPQSLLLEVAGPQAEQLGAAARKQFSGNGGTIGRADDCDWVLKSAGVSRVHAVVRHLNGMYFIEDRSSNGLQLNGTRLQKGDPAALKQGDRLLFDTIEVSVRLSDAGVPAAPAASAVPELASHSAQARPAPVLPDDFDDLIPAAAPRPQAVGGGGPNPIIPALIPDEALIPGDIGGGGIPSDPLSFLGGPAIPAETANPIPPAAWNHTPGPSDHFHPPPVHAPQSAASMLPEDWDLDEPSAAPAVTPAAAAAPGARLADITPPPEAPAPVPAPVREKAAYVPPVAAAAPAALEAQVDEIFRIVVDGTMDVLRARTEIKNTFRLPVTVIQRRENNPLKFAPDAAEALQKIMGPPSPAFLSGPAAFRDAFDDIRNHQMAMLAGVRAAFERLLAEFSPDRFELEGEGAGKRLLDFAGKGKFWEKYRAHYQGLVGDPDDCFRRLFGDEFAKAYEEQLARLKAAQRRG